MSRDREAAKAYDAAYYVANRELLKARARARRSEQYDDIREKQRAYRERIRVECAAKATLVEMPACACGCGLPTTIATRTNRRHGHVRGEPCRFRKGHCVRPHRFIGSQGYVLVYSPDHPHADCKGYVYEHVAIACTALGKPLPKRAEVHHHDRTRTNNTNGNLVLCQDRAYHMLLHKRMRMVGL